MASTLISRCSEDILGRHGVRKGTPLEHHAEHTGRDAHHGFTEVRFMLQLTSLLYGSRFKFFHQRNVGKALHRSRRDKGVWDRGLLPRFPLTLPFVLRIATQVVFNKAVMDPALL